MFRFARGRGFTLVELLVGIAIISVLAAVAVPAYKSYTAKTKFAEVVLSVASLKSQISACALSGDCVSNGAVSLGAAGSASGVSGASDPGDTSVPAVQAMMKARLDAMLADAPEDMRARAYAALPDNAQAWAENYGAVVLKSQSYPGYQCLLTGGDSSGPTVRSCDAAFDYDSFTTNDDGTQTVVHKTAAELVREGILVATSDYNAALAGITGVPVAPSATIGVADGLICIGPSSPCSPPTKYVAAVSADAAGVITATAVSSSGLAGETFVLSPVLSGGRIDWITSGSCKTRDGGALC